MKAFFDNACAAQCLELYQTSSINSAGAHSLALRACAKLKDVETARLIILKGASRNPTAATEASIAFYGEMCAVSDAQKLVDSLPLHRSFGDAVVAASMMSALTQNEEHSRSLSVFGACLCPHATALCTALRSKSWVTRPEKSDYEFIRKSQSHSLPHCILRRNVRR